MYFLSHLLPCLRTVGVRDTVPYGLVDESVQTALPFRWIGRAPVVVPATATCAAPGRVCVAAPVDELIRAALPFAVG